LRLSGAQSIGRCARPRGLTPVEPRSDLQKVDLMTGLYAWALLEGFGFSETALPGCSS
jgi:hypothetical protein